MLLYGEIKNVVKGDVRSMLYHMKALNIAIQHHMSTYHRHSTAQQIILMQLNDISHMIDNIPIRYLYSMADLTPYERVVYYALERMYIMFMSSLNKYDG